MNAKLQELMKRVKNKTVFIVGGGPSVKNVDLDLLQDEVIICINDAYRYFPNCTAIYWVDESWASENYDNLEKHNCQLMFTSKFAQHIGFDPKKERKGLLGSVILKRTGDNGYDPRIDCVMGNNSGTQVINLIVNMKPKTIVLLGYDMKHVDRKSHWHDGKRLPITPTVYTDLFIPSTNALAKEINKRKLDVDIVNANPNSALRCFRYDDYKSFLKAK
jgi:hypothetical protein